MSITEVPLDSHAPQANPENSLLGDYETYDSLPVTRLAQALPPTARHALPCRVNVL